MNNKHYNNMNNKHYNNMNNNNIIMSDYPNEKNPPSQNLNNIAWLPSLDNMGNTLYIHPSQG